MLKDYRWTKSRWYTGSPYKSSTRARVCVAKCGGEIVVGSRMTSAVSWNATPRGNPLFANCAANYYTIAPHWVVCCVLSALVLRIDNMAGDKTLDTNREACAVEARYQPRHPFLSGGIAGCLEICLTFPFE